jgi:integrase
VSIVKRTTSSGEARYDVRLRTPDKKVMTRTFRTRRDAERFERAQLAERDRGGRWLDRRAGQKPFGVFALDWLAGDPAKRPRTKHVEGSMLRASVLPFWSDRSVASITPRDVQQLVRRWQEVPGPTGRSAGPATVRRRYGMLRSIFAAAVLDGLRVDNPCIGVKLPAVERKARPILEDPADVARLLAQFSDADRCLVELLLATGARFGEVAGLRCVDVDLLRSRLTIRRSIGDATGKIIVSPTKTSTERSVELYASTCAMLAEHMHAAGLTAASDAWLFQGKRGGPIRYGVWRQRTWRPAVEQAGLAGLTTYALRRSAITAALAAGVDVAAVARRSGHSPAVLLRHYAQPSPAVDRRAAELIAERLGLGDVRAKDAR